MTDTTPASEAVVIERTFAAPIELVWQMWTDAEHFQAWYGPPGATIPVAELDVRVGGRRFVAMEMQTPDGAMRMHFVGEHRVVDAPNRLTYTEAMADEHGDPLPPERTGMPDGHPTQTEVVVELQPADAGTALRLTHVGVPAGSPGAMGWNMALDKLAAKLDGSA